MHWPRIREETTLSTEIEAKRLAILNKLVRGLPGAPTKGRSGNVRRAHQHEFWIERAGISVRNVFKEHAHTPAHEGLSHIILVELVGDGTVQSPLSRMCSWDGR